MSQNVFMVTTNGLMDLIIFEICFNVSILNFFGYFTRNFLIPNFLILILFLDNRRLSTKLLENVNIFFSKPSFGKIFDSKIYINILGFFSFCHYSEKCLAHQFLFQFFSNIWIFVKIRFFAQNFEFLAKIWIFEQNLDFSPNNLDFS